jgi:hypothetical protein
MWEDGVVMRRLTLFVPVTELVCQELQLLEWQLAIRGQDVLDLARYGSGDESQAVPRDVMNGIAAWLGNLTCGVEGPHARGRWRAEYYDDLSSINAMTFTFARVRRAPGDVRDGLPGSEPVRFEVTAISPSGRTASFDFGSVTGIVTAFPLKEWAASDMWDGLLCQFDICRPAVPGGTVTLDRAEILPGRDDHSRVSSFVYLQLVGSLESLLDRKDVTARLDDAPIKNDVARLYFRSGMAAPIHKALLEQMRRLVPHPQHHTWRQLYTTRKLPQWDGRPPLVLFQTVSEYGEKFRKVYGKAAQHVSESADFHPMYAIDFARLFNIRVDDDEKAALCNLLNRLWDSDGGTSGILRKVA